MEAGEGRREPGGCRKEAEREVEWRWAGEVGGTQDGGRTEAGRRKEGKRREAGGMQTRGREEGGRRGHEG